MNNKYFLPLDSIDNVIKVFENMRWKNIIITDYHEVILQAFTGFLFIQALNKEQLIYLKDIGVNISANIYEWGTQRYAGCFFEDYFKGYKSEDIKYNSPNNTINDDYQIEQVIKTLRAYKSIVNFNFNKVNISNGYIYNIDKIGRLLAVSVTGESNKIVIWDMDSGMYEPIASLAGLYESVKKVKITRDNGDILVTAKGERQIYVWNIALRDEMPKSIFKVSKAGIDKIEDYILYRANDDALYIIGLIYKRLVIWDVNGNELPIKSYKPEEGDAYIFDSKLSSSSPCYEMIGEGLKILELKEKNILEFSCSKKINLNNVFDLRISDEFDFGNKQFYYSNICHENGLIGSLIGEDIYIIDLVTCLQNNFIIEKKGQGIFKFKFLKVNKVIYILGYCIYSCSKDNQSGLISCWKIEDMKIIEERQWFNGKKDVLSATILQCHNDIKILFSQAYDNVIYSTIYNSADYTKFYELPKSFSILEMVCE